MLAYRKPNYNQTLPNIITGMEATTSGRTASVLRQPIRNLQTTIQVLDTDGSIIDTITGHVVDGTINYSATSLIRRTGSLRMIVDPEYLPSKKSVVWFGKRFRVYQGIVDLYNNPKEAVNFLLGTFWVDDSSLTYDEDSGSISVTLSDKMTLWEDRGLENEIKIDIGTPMSQCMRMIMELVGETDFGYMYESNSEEVMPYKYDKQAGTMITDIIQDFRDMYMDYICGYDVLGRFEYRKIEMQKKDETREPKWQFDTTASDRSDLTLSFNESYTLKDVANRVVVIGSTNVKTGYTPKGEVKIVDASNPFSVDAIGTRTKVVTNSDLTNDLQCVAQARYELWKTAHFQEQVDITVVPVYLLQPNDLITVTNPVTRETYRYMIDTISTDLGVDGVMSITAHKMYYVGLDYGKAEMPVVEALKNGIEHLGWLSLGEQRAKDCYGISGSGDNTIMVRFIVGEKGGEQASTTPYYTTKNQTLELDITDFQKLDMKNQNGDTGRSKGDYADRILGHEMFHAVCNDYYGAFKIGDIPTWWKEGFAELLHGAKERYQSMVGYAGNDETKKAIIDHAKNQLLTNYWGGTSDDYVYSYAIAAAIYYLCGTKERFQQMFQNIATQENVGLDFLYKALPFLGNSSQEIANKIIDEMDKMPLWTYLNDNTDADTCSIGGSHMMNIYNHALDAEDVFNNDEATTISLGFKIRYDE